MAFNYIFVTYKWVAVNLINKMFVRLVFEVEFKFMLFIDAIYQERNAVQFIYCNLELIKLV